MKVNSINDLKKEINKSEKLKKEFQENPIAFLDNIDTSDPTKDKGVFLFIVSIVGAVLLIALILGIKIIMDADDSQTAKVPEFLVSIASTALGAIVGLLAPSPKK